MVGIGLVRDMWGYLGNSYVDQLPHIKEGNFIGTCGTFKPGQLHPSSQYKP